MPYRRDRFNGVVPPPGRAISSPVADWLRGGCSRSYFVDLCVAALEVSRGMRGRMLVQEKAPD